MKYKVGDKIKLSDPLFNLDPRISHIYRDAGYFIIRSVIEGEGYRLFRDDDILLGNNCWGQVDENTKLYEFLPKPKQFKLR